MTLRAALIVWFSKQKSCLGNIPAAASDAQMVGADWFQLTNQKWVLKAPKKLHKPWVCLCKNPKNKKKKNHGNSPVVLEQNQNLKLQVSEARCEFQPGPGATDPSWLSHIHGDHSEKVELLDAHHLVIQRVYAVFVHGLSSVSNPVKPGTKNSIQTLQNQQPHS